MRQIAKEDKEAALFIGLSIGLGVLILRGYVFPTVQFVLLLILSPIILRGDAATKGSPRFLIVSAFLGILYPFLHIKILLWLGIGTYILGILEYYRGKMTVLPLLVLVILSPSLQYIINVFTFPIRLSLSAIAGKALHFVDKTIVCKGNYFEHTDGSIFSVDTACVGLNMIATGMALCVLMIGFEAQKRTKNLPFWAILALLTFNFLLLVLANLLRIVVLVLLRWLPDSIGHEAVGLASLALYVLLPMYFVVIFVFKKWGKTPKTYQVKWSFSNNKFRIMAITVLGLLFFVGKIPPPQYLTDKKAQSVTIAGLQKTVLETGVVEFKNDTVLLYIKPASVPWGSDHTPLICWKASGYTFQKIEEISIGNTTVHKAILQQGQNTLHTVWWYDNGSDKTISQWRWRVNRGEPYRLINVTARDERTVLDNARRFLTEKWF